MEKYCNILDKNTGLVEIGVGCPDEYYIEIGMVKRNVRESDIDGQWYLQDKCPMEPAPTAEDRRKDFLQRFFLVPNYGYYRRQPKGYASAVESINTADRMCAKNNGLPAGVLIFYKEPDFNKPGECTEEWLTANQIVMPDMTVSEFDQLYNVFITVWNTQEHN